MAVHSLLMSLSYRRHVPLKDLADPSSVSRRLIRQLYEDEVRVTHSCQFTSQSQGAVDGSAGGVLELAGCSLEALSSLCCWLISSELVISSSS